MYGEADEIAFSYRPTKASKYVAEILGETFAGVLLSDGNEAYARYAQARAAVTHAECWAHTRRYFDRAKDAEPQAANEALAIIGELYRHETTIRDKKLTGEAKLKHRTQCSEPVVHAFWAWCERQCQRHDLLPSNPLSKALKYAMARVDSLKVFLGDPDVPIDTNHLERALRPIPMGRKNWLFSNTASGAQASAMMYSIVETATSSSLVTVALFLLMGEILFRSGTVDVLFDSIDRLVGKLRGRLYVVVMALSTVFGALSGSAVAVAAMLGRSLLPMMQKRNYDVKLSASTILAGASLAPIIPPSLLAIIIGSLADVSIAGLLIGGIGPGLLLAGLTIGYVYLRLPAEDASKVEEIQANLEKEQSVLLAVLRMIPFLIVIFSVMGLIMLGVATPSESAATGVAGAVIVAGLWRKLSIHMIVEAVRSAVAITAVLLIIVCSAKLFSQLLSFTGATRGLVTFAINLDLSPDMTLLIMMAIPFFICMFVDQFAFLLMAVPIYQPLVNAMEFDPVWFWTLFLINLTVGSLTPPFGYTLFALRGASDQLTTLQVFSAAWPVVLIFLSGMFIIWLAPGIVTILPGVLN